MFADDSTLTTISRSPDSIAANLNFDLAEVESWCKFNSMSINVEKTKTMLLGTKPKHKYNREQLPVIQLHDTPLQHTSCEKLLGIHMDESLTWQIQVENTVKNATHY